jgi:hypothetical protein
MADIVQKLWGFCQTLQHGRFIFMKSNILLLTLSLMAFAVATGARAQTNAASPMLGLGSKTGQSVTQTPNNTLSIKLDDETRKILRETTEGKWFKKDAFFSTVLGGVLAALAGFGAIWFADRLQYAQKKRENAEFRANVLSALRREVEALGEIYDKGIGAQLATIKTGEVFEVRLALTQDWFTVYSANASNLGKFEADISHRIITVYALLKSLIEEFKINNEYLTQREQIDFQILQRPEVVYFHEKRKIVQAWMVAEATKIKTVERALKSAVADLNNLFDARGIK